MAGCARGCAVPKLTREAHNFKITPVHCNLLTYGHLTSEVLFYTVNMSTKFYVSSTRPIKLMLKIGSIHTERVD